MKLATLKSGGRDGTLVVVDDVPMGVAAPAAGTHIKLKPAHPNPTAPRVLGIQREAHHTQEPFSSSGT